MTKEIMTLEQLKEYIRNMPDGEILAIHFDEEDSNDRDDANDREPAV